jgi:hypothetical protein
MSKKQKDWLTEQLAFDPRRWPRDWNKVLGDPDATGRNLLPDLPPLVAPLDQPSPAPGKTDIMDFLTTLPSVVSQPAPPVEVWGYWRGQSGSILSVRKVSGNSRAIRVEGDALDQKVQGEGSIDGDKISVRLKLLTERKELNLELRMTADVQCEGDVLSGSARDGDGVARNVRFYRLAPHLEGEWREDSENYLSFSDGRLDWRDGRQEVRASVTGRIFGRSGTGELELGQGSLSVNIARGRRVIGGFDATDFSHRNQYLSSHLFDHDWEKWYVRNCPKEGWWGSKYLFLALEMSADGSFLAGTVEPRQEGITARLHLQRRPAPQPRERSLF